MAPVSWNGSNTLYHRVIKPFVLKHQKDIDKALDKVGQKVDEVAKEGGLKMFANIHSLCIQTWTCQTLFTPKRWASTKLIY